MCAAGSLGYVEYDACSWFNAQLDGREGEGEDDEGGDYYEELEGTEHEQEGQRAERGAEEEEEEEEEDGEEEEEEEHVRGPEL